MHKLSLRKQGGYIMLVALLLKQASKRCCHQLVSHKMPWWCAAVEASERAQQVQTVRC